LPLGFDRLRQFYNADSPFLPDRSKVILNHRQKTSGFEIYGAAGLTERLAGRPTI
jgi:hypothetical protein